MLPSRVDWRFQGIEWLEKNPEAFYAGAAFFAAIAFVFLLGFYGVGRGQYLRLHMKPREVFIDVKLLEHALEACVKEHFPLEIYGASVAVAAKERLEVAFDFAPLDPKEKEETLRKAEEQLGILLRDRFGYTKPFTMVLHLKNPS